MTLQTLKIGNKEFILLAKRDFEKLAAQAQRQTEDDYWTRTALQAEAKSRSGVRDQSSLKTSSGNWTPENHAAVPTDAID